MSQLPIPPNALDVFAGAGQEDVGPALLRAYLAYLWRRIEHGGWNPFPWIRALRPRDQEEAITLLGIAQQLMNPDLSLQDLDNLARDLYQDPRARRALKIE